jgi:hypothetical protein
MALLSPSALSFYGLVWWWSRYFGLRDAMTKHALLPRRFPPPWIVEDLLVVKDNLERMWFNYWQQNNRLKGDCNAYEEI